MSDNTKRITMITKRTSLSEINPICEYTKILKETGWEKDVIMKFDIKIESPVKGDPNKQLYVAMTTLERV